MELNKTVQKAVKISQFLQKRLGKQMARSSITSVIDQIDYQSFEIPCLLYDYYSAVFQYETGTIGCVIFIGRESSVSIIDGRRCESEADLETFIQELQKEIELRVPDKFLKSRGWL